MIAQWLDAITRIPLVSDIGRSLVEDGFKRHRQELVRVRSLASGRVLDLGCGTGLLSSVFDPERYLGIDVNPQVLRAARTRNPQHQYKLVDGTSIPLPDQWFELVVIVGVLHHLDEGPALRVLEETARILKSDGVLYVCEDVPAAPGNWIGTSIHRHDQGAFIRTPDEYRSLLRPRFRIEEEGAFLSGFMDYHTFVARPSSGLIPEFKEHAECISS